MKTRSHEMFKCEVLSEQAPYWFFFFLESLHVLFSKWNFYLIS